MPIELFDDLLFKLSNKNIKKVDLKLKELRLKDVNSKYINWFKDNLVTKFSSTQNDYITIKTEKEYVNSKIVNDKTFLFGIFYNKEHIGNILIKINRFNYSGEVSYLIGETDLWNKGIGSRALEMACEYAKNDLNLKFLTAGVVK